MQTNDCSHVNGVLNQPLWTEREVSTKPGRHKILEIAAAMSRSEIV